MKDDEWPHASSMYIYAKHTTMGYVYPYSSRVPPHAHHQAFGLGIHLEPFPKKRYRHSLLD